MQQTMSEQLCSGDRESPQSSPPSPSVVPHDTSTVSVTPITHILLIILISLTLLLQSPSQFLDQMQLMCPGDAIPNEFEWELSFIPHACREENVRCQASLSCSLFKCTICCRLYNIRIPTTHHIFHKQVMQHIMDCGGTTPIKIECLVRSCSYYAWWMH